MDFDLNVLWKLADESAVAAALYLESFGVDFCEALSIVSGLQSYIFADEIRK